MASEDGDATVEELCSVAKAHNLVNLVQEPRAFPGHTSPSNTLTIVSKNLTSRFGDRDGTRQKACSLRLFLNS